MDKVRFHLNAPPSPKRDVRWIGDVLKDVVDGLEQPTQENILILRRAWAKLVGVQIAKHSEPGFVKDFQLHIFVDHPGWMSELERIKHPLLRKLQSSYRDLRIRKICFLLQYR